MRRILWLIPVILLAGCPSKPPTSPNSALVYNPWNGLLSTGYTNAITSSGFYLKPYPGTSMSSAVLWLLVNSTGSYNYNLTARDSSYSGTVIGTASSGAVPLLNNSSYQAVTFTFGGNPGVTKNNTVAFTLSAASGPGVTSYCPQASGSNNLIIQLTNGTSSPLGNDEGTGVAVVINGNS